MIFCLRIIDSPVKGIAAAGHNQTARGFVIAHKGLKDVCARHFALTADQAASAFWVILRGGRTKKRRLAGVERLFAGVHHLEPAEGLRAQADLIGSIATSRRRGNEAGRRGGLTHINLAAAETRNDIARRLIDAVLSIRASFRVHIGSHQRFMVRSTQDAGAAACIPATGKSLAHRHRANRAAHRGRVIIDANQTTASIFLGSCSPVVIHSFIHAAICRRGQTDRFGLLFLNVLRHQTDLSAVVAVVFEAVDGQTVVGLTDLLSVVLQAFVGEERGRLGRRGGRTRQRASAHRDVREELSRLEGVALLLQELLVFGSEVSLFCLLADSASRQKSLTALNARLLSASAKPRQLLRALKTTSHIRSSNALLAHSCLGGLLVALLIERRNSLRGAKPLLALQRGPFNSRPIPKTRAGLDGPRLLLVALHPLLTLQSLQSGVNNSLRERVLVVADLLLRQRADILRCAQSHPSSGIIVGLGGLR